MRPKAKEGFLFPVLLEHSSYHNGTVMWSAVSGSAFDEYPEMREPFRYKHNWPIHRDLNDPIFKDTTHLTYEDIRYKGMESYNWPWDNMGAFNTGSWYTGKDYGNVPPATVSATDPLTGEIIYEAAPGFNFGNDMFATHPAFGGNMSTQVPNYYRYYLPRGYALVLGQLLGNRDSDGVTSTLHVEEVLSAMAIINWLNGDAKGYTSRRGNIEVKADWAIGNVAMAGRSYPADIAFATVVSGVKGLKAVMPQCNGLNWYDYYRYAGTVNYPGGYGGEDLNNHASINFTRWRADLPPGGSTSNYFPDPNGQWFPKAVQDVFFETQKYMIETTDSITGDYNTEWETRNFGRLVGNINEDVGLLMTTAFMDWNSQPKLSLANWTVLLDKCPGTFREFISISSHTDQQWAVIYGKSIAEWWHSWMDHFLLGLDNGVVEALPDLTVINSKNGDVEGYWIKGNPNAQPGDKDYEPVFLERGGIVPGARNQKIYMVPGQDGKAGRLSYNAPAATVEHFNDMNVLDMLQATYPGAPTLTETQKTINLSSDGNYRATTGNGVASQSQFCEGRAIGVNRTYDFGISGTAPADIQAINQQIFAAVDKPIEGRLLYLSDPLTEEVRLSGAGALYLMAAPDKGVGNLSAAVVEIGRVRNMESSRANAWSMTPGTGNNLLTPAYSLIVGGGTSFTLPVGTFRNPSEVGAFMNYKYVTVGYADVQNPDPTGKTWCEVPEQNYIPNFYFQTTRIVPGQYYPYTIEFDPYDYIFRTGSRIGLMVLGTDPDYSLLYDECCIPEFDIKIGPESYAILPLLLAEPDAPITITVASEKAAPGDTVEIAYSVSDNDLGFSALAVELPFDSSLYAPVDVIPSTLLSGVDFTYAIAANVLSVTIAADDNIAGNGQLFTVLYKVSDAAPPIFNATLDVIVKEAIYGSFLDKTVDVEVIVKAGLLTPYNFNLYVKAGQAAYEAGDTVLVDVLLCGNLNYTQVNAAIAYDATVLEYTGHANLSGLAAEIKKSGDGMISLRSVPTLNMLLGASCLNPVKLVTLQFKVKDTKADIDATVGIAARTVYPAAGVSVFTTSPGKSIAIPITIK